MVPPPPKARACHVCPIRLPHLATAGFSHAELERLIGGVGTHRLRVSRVRRGDVVIRHGEVRHTATSAPSRLYLGSISARYLGSISAHRHVGSISARPLGDIPSHPIAQNATFLGIVLGGELGVKLVTMSAIPKRLQKQLFRCVAQSSRKSGLLHIEKNSTLWQCVGVVPNVALLWKDLERSPESETLHDLATRPV